MPQGSPRPPPGSRRPGAPEPLPAVKAALGRVLAHLAAGAADVLLLGPPGVGKTVALRELAAHWSGRVFYCPFLHFEPAEASRWLASLAGTPPGSEPAAVAAALAAGATPARPNLLLLDEAQTIPEPTLAALVGWLEPAGPALRRVWAGIDGSALQRIPARVGPEMARVPLVYRMDVDETRAGLAQFARDPALSPEERRAASDLLRGGVEGVGDVPGELRRRVEARMFRERQRPARGAAPTPEGIPLSPTPAPAPAPPPAVAPEPPATSSSAAPARGRSRIAAPAAVVAAGVAVLLLALAIAAGLGPADEGVAPAVPPTPAAATPPAATGATPPPAAAAPPAAPVGVSVDVNAVPWAHIAVDGREVGATPLGGLVLMPGSHTIEARFPDGERLSREVEVGTAPLHIGFRR